MPLSLQQLRSGARAVVHAARRWAACRAAFRCQARPGRLWWVAALMLGAWGQQAQAQSFGSCDARMFLGLSSGGTDAQLNRIDTGANPFNYLPIGSPSTPAYDAIGFNPLDNYLYGVDYGVAGGNDLIRIAADGFTVVLGAMALSTGGAFPEINVAGGAFSPSGEYYISSRTTNTLYRVNLATRVATPVLAHAALGLIIDFAFVGSDIYAPSGDRLVRINPSTGTVTMLGSGVDGVGAPSVWGFANGGLYSLQDGELAQWDIVAGTRLTVGSGPVTSHADGANCANAAMAFSADLSLTVTNTPAQGPSDLPGDTYVPGAVRTYTIVVRNGSSSFGAQNNTVSAPVPAGIDAGSVSWTCSATSGGARCGAASGSGALSDTGLDLPPGAVATYTVTMTVPSGFTGPLANTVTITPPSTINDASPANNTATDTDIAAARVTIRKLSLAGVGAFGFTGSNGVAAQTLTTTVAGTPVSGAVQVLTALDTATTITEAASPGGYTLTAIGCTGLTGGTATPNLATRTVTLDAAATASGANITCTFTNTRPPQLRLQKLLPSGRAVAGDQFRLSMTGMVNLTTTGTGNTANGVLTHNDAMAGASYRLSETAVAGANLANYTSGYSCSNTLPGGQTPSGAGVTFVVTLVTGDDLSCSFSNAAIPGADLQILKAASVPTMRSGEVVSFTLTGRNNGPGAANGAVIRDVPGTGLDCSAPGPTASCSASGGAACPGATVPVANLLGSGGVTIPVLPAGGGVVITLQCRVTATGLP